MENLLGYNEIKYDVVLNLAFLLRKVCGPLEQKTV